MNALQYILLDRTEPAKPPATAWLQPKRRWKNAWAQPPQEQKAATVQASLPIMARQTRAPRMKRSGRPRQVWTDPSKVRQIQKPSMSPILWEMVERLARGASAAAQFRHSI